MNNISHDLSSLVQVKIKYGELKNVIRWCELNCTGDWTFYPPEVDFPRTGPETDVYGFLFDDDKDKLIFNLRWNWSDRK